MYIHEHKELERNLHKSEAQMRLMADSLPVLISFIDKDHRYQFNNKAYEEWFESSRDEMAGRHMKEILGDQFYESILPHIKEGFAGSRVHYKTEITLYSGELKYVDVNYVPHISEDGSVDGLYILVHDITEAMEKKSKLDDRLRFEGLISNISSTFVNLPAEEVDCNIEKGLLLICESLGADLGTVLQFNDEEKVYVVTHECSSEAIEDGARFRGSKVDESYPWLSKKLEKGKPLIISSLDDFPESAVIERKVCEKFDIRSVVWAPFCITGKVKGYIALNTTKIQTVWTKEFLQRIQLLGEVFGNALERARNHQKLQKALYEIEKLKNQLEKENIYLRKEIKLGYNDDIIGESDVIKEVLSQAEQVADMNSTVLILGETGTGKELLARLIHKMSRKRDRTMVKVNCASLPSNLIESELFGREKGAYTGAMAKQMGRFELADGATIFLDEIGEMPLDLQVKLLRVLQDGEFERLGSPRTVKVNVRVIAATNCDLSKLVEEGRFRQDLYYRLNVFPITIPPLRERCEDIPMLVWAFIKEFGTSMGKTIEKVPKTSMDALQRYPWQGNVRELRNVIERAMILSKGPTLEIDLPRKSRDVVSHKNTLVDIEKNHIQKVMEQTAWRIRGKGGAAEILGMKPTTLDSRIQRLGIKRRHSPSDIS